LKISTGKTKSYGEIAQAILTASELLK